MIKVDCRVCGRNKEAAQGTCEERHGSHIDIRLTAKRPVCQECISSIADRASITLLMRIIEIDERENG
jgi:hypothetical protein